MVAMEVGMAGPVKVLFWNTTFQADVAALARFLCKDSRFDVRVALTDRESYMAEPIQKVLPVPCILWERDSRQTAREIAEFGPDVVVVDNHFPKKKWAPYLFVLWHGFGWKGPNDVKEFASVHKAIKKLTGGSGMKPNDRFLWQCFGPTDLEHRHSVSGFARENLASLGAAFTDELLAAPVTRDQAKAFYPELSGFDQVVFFAMTWHYGRAFGHFGDDVEIFGRLVGHLRQRGAGVILRMHDRHRFDPDYLQALEGLASRTEGMVIKYKDKDRDSLLDMVVSDVMVSNFSSILNYWYATKKPSIHVYPVRSAQEAFLWRTWKRGKLRITKVPSAEYVWKLPPEENGGLMVHSVDELLAALDRSLDEPDCCRAASQRFIERHMAPVDGHTRERIAEAVLALVSGRKMDLMSLQGEPGDKDTGGV